MKNSTQTTLLHFNFSVRAELNDVTSRLIILINETGSRSPCMRPRSDPPKMKNSKVVRSRLIILINEEINEANWMVSNSSKSSCTLKLESVRVTVPEIWPGQNRGGEKKINKNNEANWMVSNCAKLDRRTKQHTQFGVSASNGSRDMARTKSWGKKKKKKIIIIITKRIGW